MFPTLKDAADIGTIASVVLQFVVAFGGGFLAIGYIKKMRPVWKRFSENISRRVAVISTEEQAMEHEANVLEQVGYFKIKRISADIRNLDLIRNCSLLVVGYSPNSEMYKASLDYAKSRRLPIVVFSGKHRLSKEVKNNLRSYSFSSLCETELRLVADVFAVMSTFPKDLK
jgi:hypothetical protein